jgi:hypothetical protein
MVSCNKDQNFSTLNGKPQISKSIAYNPNNPYDSVGIWHNEALDYFVSLGWDSTTIQSKTKYSLDSAYDLYFSSINFPLNTTEINSTLYLQDFWFGSLYESSVSEIVDYAYTNNIISPIVKSYCDTIINIIESSTEYSTADLTFDALIDTFTSYENQIILRSMNSTDRAIVLSLTSVAKHSSEYWKTQANLPNDIYGIDWESLAAFNWKWKECVQQDVVGGIAGGITAAITGVGILPGAGIGAFGGSLRYTLNELYDHIFN